MRSSQQVEVNVDNPLTGVACQGQVMVTTGWAGGSVWSWSSSGQRPQKVMPSVGCHSGWALRAAVSDGIVVTAGDDGHVAVQHVNVHSDNRQVTKISVPDTSADDKAKVLPLWITALAVQRQIAIGDNRGQLTCASANGNILWQKKVIFMSSYLLGNNKVLLEINCSVVFAV